MATSGMCCNANATAAAEVRTHDNDVHFAPRQMSQRVPTFCPAVSFRRGESAGFRTMRRRTPWRGSTSAGLRPVVNRADPVDVVRFCTLQAAPPGGRGRTLPWQPHNRNQRSRFRPAQSAIAPAVPGGPSGPRDTLAGTTSARQRRTVALPACWPLTEVGQYGGFTLVGVVTAAPKVGPREPFRGHEMTNYGQRFVQDRSRTVLVSDPF